MSDSDVSAFAALGGVRHVVHRARDGAATLELRLEEERALVGALGMMEARGIHLTNLTKREPTLEDVFVDLVGRSMEEVEHA